MIRLLIQYILISILWYVVGTIISGYDWNPKNWDFIVKVSGINFLSGCALISILEVIKTKEL